MKTSRGLQVTSLVVLSPVLLILFSLLVILTTTLFSQFQLWCLPLFSYQATRSISKWASTAVVLSFNNTPLVLPLTDDANNVNNTDNNDTNNSNTPSLSTLTNVTNHSRSQLLVSSWLKRWRHSKRKSPFVWTCCSVPLLISLVYIKKTHVQKRQVYQAIQHLCNSVIKYSKKLVRSLECIMTGSSNRHRQLMQTRTADAVDGNAPYDDGAMRITLKRKDQPQQHQQQLRAKISGTTHQRHHYHHQRHHHHVTKKVKKQSHSRHHQHQAGDEAHIEKEQQCMNLQGALSNSSDDEDRPDTNGWINVSQKKKKTTAYQQYDYDKHDSNIEIPALDSGAKKDSEVIGDEYNDADDDDDKTVVDSSDNSKLTSIAVTSDDETELDSPCLLSSDTAATHHHTPPPSPPHQHHYHYNYHHEQQQQRRQQQQQGSGVRNWYSPFSTGLDIDILPRYDPLTQLDPMQLRQQHHPPLLHAVDYYQRQHDHNQCHSKNVLLLQNHPFIVNSHRVAPSATSAPSLPSSTLGAIGQHYPSSSPFPSVQNAKSHPFSLFG